MIANTTQVLTIQSDPIPDHNANKLKHKKQLTFPDNPNNFSGSFVLCTAKYT
jgi:hypothetical protein